MSLPIRLYMSTSLDDVEACATQARAAAGDRALMVHGAGAAQSLLRAGLLDEPEIHLVQVLLGQGRRLFDNLGTPAQRTRAGKAAGGPRRHAPALPGSPVARPAAAALTILAVAQTTRSTDGLRAAAVR
jgi:hypothetical protein